jgi:putative ABC transport system ATP-binding protein
MIEIRDLQFTYPKGGFRVHVNRLDLAAGEQLGITGSSGSGKTTLIRLISGILKPDSGSVKMAGMEITRANEARIRRFRLENIGFIFQDFELLEYLTVEQNILLPFILSRRSVSAPDIKERLSGILKTVGLAGRELDYPGALSHGEKQRVAVCRAVITLPRLVIGDEPTANLDEENARSIMDLILNLVQEHGASLILVTHNPAVAGRLGRRLDLGRKGSEVTGYD